MGSVPPSRESAWRFNRRAGSNDQTGKPDRAIGLARRTLRACPTNASGLPGRPIGQARINDRAGDLAAVPPYKGTSGESAGEN